MIQMRFPCESFGMEFNPNEYKRFRIILNQSENFTHLVRYTQLGKSAA